MSISQQKLLNMALLEGIPGGVMVADTNAEIVAINNLALKLLNINEDNIIGKKVANTVPNTRIDKVLNTKKAELYRYQNLNDTKILTNRVPIFHKGRIIGVVAYFQEVREAEEMAKRLESVQRLKKNLETVLNSIDEGIHVIDETGKTIFYNSKMAKLEHLEKDKVINKNLLEVFPSLNQETSTLMKTLASKEAISEHQQTYVNYKGEEITTINKTIPIILEDQFIGALEMAKDVTEIKELSEKILDLQSELYNHDKERNKDKLNNGTSYVFSDIVGESWNLEEKIKYAKRAAKTSSSVLISGQTGTGKELFAQSIHNASNRREEPFIAQNCAALPKDLLEGILFGTKEGGFTGAVDRKGLFEQANGGTLLLDEINSLSMELQAKLLRVLQEGIIMPIGANERVKVDVRIIATINKSPLKALQDGELRKDLYYRLAVVNLSIPPLKERKNDIPLLVEHFINKFNRKFNYNIKGISKEVEEIFLDCEWPGNVRQLEHVIEGAMNIVGRTGQITEKDIKPFMLNLEKEKNNGIELSQNQDLPDIIENIEKKLIKEEISKTSGNVSQAARNLGVTRQSLQYKLNKYNLDKNK